MAKKKASKPKMVTTKQKSLFSIKGDPAFVEWLKELADFASLPMTNTIDLALKQFAERIKFPKPMPRRQVR